MGPFQLLQQSSANLITVSFVLGLLVGSFLNVVIYRLPIMLQRNWRQQCCEFLEIQDPQPAEKKSTSLENLSLAEPLLTALNASTTSEPGKISHWSAMCCLAADVPVAR